MNRESMEVDVVIVGAGPAGLATACRLGQIAQEKGQEISVVVLEKGSEIGAHILSGAVMEPRAMNELFPDWKDRGAPLNVPVTQDDVFYFTQSGAIPVPRFLVPPATHNDENYIVSLGNVCRWLAEQAEGLGIEIFPGFAASEILYADDAPVSGQTRSGTGTGGQGQWILFARGGEL
tara:strand:- start:118 stop:648 length:531 start_codon:yes stop_codon:yes gene_type:complete